MMLNMYFLRRITRRFFSSKPSVNLDNDLDNLLEKKLLKHRQHPGIIKPRFIEVPNWIKDSIKLVLEDSSSQMNALSEELNKHNTHPIKNVFYRQFFPATPVLWAKTQNYLVIIEEGTNAGFSAINEARDIILYNNSPSDDNNNNNNNNNNCHVCAPCPHDMKCPRYHTDNTPCNFEISYYTLPVSGVSNLKTNHYSYVVLKKGVRSDSDKQWPRIVRPTLKRSKHVVCRTCTANGKLEEIIFTTFKYGKNAYRCARVSKWGDLLPIDVSKDK
ncbi:hypothetical protein M0802_002731 [Mischocyttarus mexicanus]|nr:hypothetical protein M0802_002731 [Mischocyttarus mexicanus]